MPDAQTDVTIVLRAIDQASGPIRQVTAALRQLAALGGGASGGGWPGEWSGTPRGSQSPLSGLHQSLDGVRGLSIGELPEQVHDLNQGLEQATAQARALAGALGDVGTAATEMEASVVRASEGAHQALAQQIQATEQLVTAHAALAALARCYAILDRLGREADLAGQPDPPPDAQAFGHLSNPAEGDVAMEPET